MWSEGSLGQPACCHCLIVSFFSLLRLPRLSHRYGFRALLNLVCGSYVKFTTFVSFWMNNFNLSELSVVGQFCPSRVNCSGFTWNARNSSFTFCSGGQVYNSSIQFWSILLHATCQQWLASSGRKCVYWPVTFNSRVYNTHSTSIHSVSHSIKLHNRHALFCDQNLHRSTVCLLSLAPYTQVWTRLAYSFHMGIDHALKLQ